ncbi:hypothetical protein Kisp02_65260 [Kineosporia sp. NBRC 101731]|nr:hypothetical protein Kisp02_65260 [Kineosporia sp. NBRC 101731]
MKSSVRVCGPGTFVCVGARMPTLSPEPVGDPQAHRALRDACGRAADGSGHDREQRSAKEPGPDHTREEGTF